ncbi:MAG: transposase [Spirochaetaceae bacterium]|nr:transposase [Spirochaetaceae bacterium]
MTGILKELKNRGVQDILLVAADGPTGFPGTIVAVFPKTEVQLCMRTKVRVHRVRTRFGSPRIKTGRW